MSDAKQFPAGSHPSDASGSGRSPNSSLPNSSGNLLQSGLLALKQKDYQNAVWQLEAVCQTSPMPGERLKAEMGLVKAYARTQQPQKAIELCRTLCNSPNPQVQHWATQTLGDLERRYGETFVAAPAEAPTSPDWMDETGFVPLDENTADPAHLDDAIDSTGFIPSVIDAAIDAAPFSLENSLEIQPETKQGIEKGTENTVKREIKKPTENMAPPGQTLVLPISETSNRAARSTAFLSAGAASSRLPKGASLGSVDRSGFWALQVGTILFFVGWINALLSFGRDRYNDFVLSIRFDWFNISFWTTYFDPFWSVVAALVGLFFASPWLLDAVLNVCYGMEDLRRSELESFSPEALRLLRHVTGSRKLPFPQLKRLPIAVPFCFAYGYLPRNARLVVSQGLLEQLEADEIAVLMAAEWGHIVQREVGILSLAAIVTQLPYLLYWETASWGNRQSNPILQGLAIGIASLGYGIYWLLRIPALLLSKVRLYFSDRLATELTGNPNALTRALLKLTIGMADSLAQHGSTPPLVESLDLLMPVSYRQALTLGSLYQNSAQPGSWANWLEWDRRQPYRRWLNALNNHPLLGDRLKYLTDYGRRWQLEPQISWQPSTGAKANPQGAQLYFAPFLGVLGGWLLAGLLWAIGYMAKQMRWLEIDWMWADGSVMTGLGLLGFSVGTFLRINAFFPDIKRSALPSEFPLADWLSDPAALPLDRHPVRLQGQLLGRRGILNRLHQDLFLQTAEGLIRLHYTTRLGFVSDILFEVVRPQIWLAPPAKTVTVIGWFRRGAVPWIDVETIQSPRGTLARSEHPLWSTILATIAALVGAFVIFSGGR